MKPLQLLLAAAALALALPLATAAAPDFDLQLYESLRPRCPSIVQTVYADRVPKGKTGDATMNYQ